MSKELVLPNILRCDLELVHQNEVLKLVHYRYQNWSDHSAPNDMKEFGDYLDEINKYRSVNAYTSPIVVHCSAGIGRTGTVILCHSLQYFLYKNDLKTKYYDISKYILLLRNQRANSLRAEEQFIFACRFLIDCVRKRDFGSK